MTRDDTQDDIEGVTRNVSRPTSPDGAILIVLSGSARGTTFAVPGAAGAVAIIGKAATSDLVLDDETVSRKHLEIMRVREGLRVRDLGSTNGTRIGAATIREALVGPGTVLSIGDIELLVAVAIDRVDVPTSRETRFELALGRSEAMRRVFGVLERAATTTASILLTGETGTGKDVLARSVHLRSGRTGAFEVVDCGAIVPGLVESELFGHERGAFTGAVSARAGAFERADGGTLFLDELGELPLELQPKLLRVLESRTFRRVGGAETRGADVRVVAATSRELRAEVAAGRFREDLYYRLAVVSLRVPPLRERIDDLPMLVESFLGGRLAVSRETIHALSAHSWPGNVRELRNVLERASALSAASGEAELRLVDFPPSALGAASASPAAGGEFDPALSYRETRALREAAFERDYVRWLVGRHAGNVSAAAREARMDRNHLSDLIRKHGLKKG
ncbi:MAG: sigma 54-dependent Fis family transcriptional regulator [Deltaproteobacteria bacterium]|nr:sigma 54-dependent Fis family transcriptional regulator [Deltaproteobacteria bacterium]